MEKIHGVLVKTGNVVIFGVHNSSLSHTNNRKNNFFILSERKSDVAILLVALVQQKKKVLTSAKQGQNFKSRW